MLGRKKRGCHRVDEHTDLDHLGNLGFVLLAVLLFTSAHYLFLKHLSRGARLIDKFPPDSADVRLDLLAGGTLH